MADSNSSASADDAVPQRGLIRRVKLNPEYSIILVGAAVVAALSLVDVIDNTKALIAATLAVLSLMAFAALRQSGRRDTEVAATNDLKRNVAELSVAVSGVERALVSMPAVGEIPSGSALSEAFEEALSNPTFWHFRGGTGSFLRARTLRCVASAARTRAASRSRVTVQILDPADDAVCERYAVYRGRLEGQRASGSATTWTARHVRFECIASLLACSWFSQHENLEVEVALLNRISTLRFDISDEIALITNEDRRFPALGVRRASSLYFAILADLEATMTSARRVDIANAPRLPRNWHDITEQQFASCMTTFVVDGSDFQQDDREEILRLAFERGNDYRRL